VPDPRTDRVYVHPTPDLVTRKHRDDLLSTDDASLDNAIALFNRKLCRQWLAQAQRRGVSHVYAASIRGTEGPAVAREEVEENDVDSVHRLATTEFAVQDE
jgi:hypothetical protein